MYIFLRFCPIYQIFVFAVSYFLSKDRYYPLLICKKFCAKKVVSINVILPESDRQTNKMFLFKKFSLYFYAQSKIIFIAVFSLIKSRSHP